MSEPIIDDYQIGGRSAGSKSCGVIIAQLHDGGPEVQRDLVQCVHCQHTFPFNPKQAKGRGFCFRCMGHLCGLPACRAKGCVPAQAMLALMEQGYLWGEIHEGLLPISVSVPRSIELVSS